jgi:hypothetical protein
MKVLLSAVLFMLGFTLAYTQPVLDSLALRYAEKMEVSRVKDHLLILASDSLAGRETGEIGQRKAAAYLSSALKAAGLSPAVNDTGFIQTYPLVEVTHESGMITVGQDTLAVLRDYYSFSFILDTSIVFNEISFLGYGISDDAYDNYKGLKMKGKAAVIAHGEPMNDETYVLSNSLLPTMWSDGYDAKIELARSQGVAVLFIVQKSFDSNLPRVQKYVKRPKLQLKLSESDGLPVIFIGSQTAELFFGKGSWELLSADMRSGVDHFNAHNEVPGRFVMKKTVKRLWSHNVMATVKGSVFPDEHVILSAHYDHLGKEGDNIFYGADDNGSGTSSLLEMARVFQEAALNGHGLKRSVSFLFFSGEEKGLLGSEYYVGAPLVPLSATVANLNVDMIGRRDASLERYYPDYIYLIGSDKLSLELHNLSEEVNENYTNLKLDYKFNDPNDPQRLYYRSDHYNFAKNRVPVIFYFRGLHEDYHKPSDTMNKLMYGSMLKVSKLIFHTAWSIAERDARIKLDEEIR